MTLCHNNDKINAAKKVWCGRGSRNINPPSSGLILPTFQLDALVLLRTMKLRTYSSYFLSVLDADAILALNKPAGLAVHGGPRLKDDLSKHLSLWQYDAPSPPELAHRLDK